MKKIALLMGLMLMFTSLAYCPQKEQRLKTKDEIGALISYFESKIPKKSNNLFAVYNNNPFNIRTSTFNNWRGKLDSNEPFERFETLDHGIRAGIKLLMNYQDKYGLDTIEKIVFRFAPPFENNTESYIQWMCEMTGFDRTTPIDLKQKETLVLFCKYMIQMETGKAIHQGKLETVYTKYFT